jgi:hypothetical protein
LAFRINWNLIKKFLECISFELSSLGFFNIFALFAIDEKKTFVKHELSLGKCREKNNTQTFKIMFSSNTSKCYKVPLSF